MPVTWRQTAWKHCRWLPQESQETEPALHHHCLEKRRISPLGWMAQQCFLRSTRAGQASFKHPPAVNDSSVNTQWMLLVGSEPFQCLPTPQTKQAHPTVSLRWKDKSFSCLPTFTITTLSTFSSSIFSSSGFWHLSPSCPGLGPQNGSIGCPIHLPSQLLCCRTPGPELVQPRESSGTGWEDNFPCICKLFSFTNFIWGLTTNTEALLPSSSDNQEIHGPCKDPQWERDRESELTQAKAFPRQKEDAWPRCSYGLSGSSPAAGPASWRRPGKPLPWTACLEVPAHSTGWQAPGRSHAWHQLFPENMQGPSVVSTETSLQHCPGLGSLGSGAVWSRAKRDARAEPLPGRRKRQQWLPQQGPKAPASRAKSMRIKWKEEEGGGGSSPALEATRPHLSRQSQNRWKWPFSSASKQHNMWNPAPLWMHLLAARGGHVPLFRVLHEIINEHAAPWLEYCGNCSYLLQYQSDLYQGWEPGYGSCRGVWHEVCHNDTAESVSGLHRHCFMPFSYILDSSYWTKSLVRAEFHLGYLHLGSYLRFLWNFSLLQELLHPALYWKMCWASYLFHSKSRK